MIIDNFTGITFKRETVKADEMVKGGEILITEMDAEKSMSFNEMVVEMNKDETVKTRFVYFMAALCAATMIREDGSLLVDPQHFKELPKKIPDSLLTRIYEKSAELNGFTSTLRKKAKKP